MAVVVPAVRRATRPHQEPLEEYACSDGKVLMETAPHANATEAMRSQLHERFEARPDVCVAGSMLSTGVTDCRGMLVADRPGLRQRAVSDARRRWCFV